MYSNSALLGFIGGADSAAALKVVHINGGRRFVSAFNSPGSYATGRRFVALSESIGWDGPHHGTSTNPDTLTSSSDPKGPKFTAAFSGTILSNTGSISKLLLESSRSKNIHVVEGRVVTPFSVTIVNLDTAPDFEEHPRVRLSAPVAFPVIGSVAAAAGCGVVGDWTSFAAIVLGIFCNSVSSYLLHSSDLTFTRPNSTPGAPAGDGYLEAGNEIIVLKGSEHAVGAVTRGYFSLRYNSQQVLNAIETCGTLLTIQCFAQLLLVPLGSVLGQLFFLVSMGVSWLYNVYVARQEKKAWGRMVFEDLLKAPSMERYSLGTRTATAVFLMQVLKPTNIEEQLAIFLPNNTPVWKTWRQTVARRLRDGKPNFQDTDLGAFDGSERMLLQTLCSDAQDSIDAFTQLNARL